MAKRVDPEDGGDEVDRRPDDDDLVVGLQHHASHLIGAAEEVGGDVPPDAEAGVQGAA